MSRDSTIAVYAIVGIVLAAGAVLAWRREIASVIPDAGIAPLPSPDLNAELFAKIDSTLASVGAAAVFRPPASAESIQALEASLGCSLPEDVRRLYRWHDGGDFLIPVMKFYSLAEIRTQHELLKEIGAGPGDWTSDLVPIAGADRAYLLLHCDSPDRGIYIGDLESPRLTRQFGSVGHLLQTLDEAYATRAFYMDYGDWRINEPLYERLTLKLSATGDPGPRLDRRVPDAITARDLGASVFDRFDAIHRLGSDPVASPVLISLLKDADVQIVARAAFELRRMRAREAIPEMLQMIREKRNRGVALASLAEMLLPGDEHVVPVLIELLEDPDKQNRISALEALGAVQSRNAVPRIVVALNDSDAGVLPYAVEALGRSGDPRALAPLRALDDRVDSLGLDPNFWGGTRGSKPNPRALRSEIRKAISSIEAATNASAAKK